MRIELNIHLFCSVPSGVCRSQQLTGQTLPPARSCCSAAAALLPALHGDLCFALISKHPASYFTRACHVLFTPTEDARRQKRLLVFCFFFYVKDVLYFWKGCVSF